MKKTATGRRSFPGRLTLEQWAAIPFRERIHLIWRAQCDLLGSYRYCANKCCKRQRTCSGDALACRQRLWRRNRVKPKPLRQELFRLDQLNAL
jgi:hypothetical protein